MRRPKLRSESEFVVFVLVLFRPTLTAGLLANAAPGMISLSTSAALTSAPSALRLKGAAHFVAVDCARKNQGHGAASLYLDAERDVVSRNTSVERSGTLRALKGAAELRTILLDLNCSLLRATPALP